MALAPTDDAGYVLQLKQLRANILTLVNNELAAQVARGGPATSYSLDGRSVSWNEWYSAMMERLDKLDAQIQRLDQAFWVRERGYT